MRRSPAPEDRVLDPDRTRAALLSAALEEFAAKGFAGARVAQIAERAGVNKQLISYYFGGKAGLYQAIQREWLAVEAQFADPSLSLGDLAVRYLEEALSDPRWARLQLWEGLAQDGEHAPPAEPDDLADFRRRRAEGELAAELDPAAVMIMLMGVVTATIALPGEVQRVSGLDPQSPAFREHYAEQLRLVIRRLAEHR
jgi:TetR/AcrR family transcriptional regulator